MHRGGRARGAVRPEPRAARDPRRLRARGPHPSRGAPPRRGRIAAASVLLVRRGLRRAARLRRVHGKRGGAAATRRPGVRDRGAGRDEGLLTMPNWAFFLMRLALGVGASVFMTWVGNKLSG